MKNAVINDKNLEKVTGGMIPGLEDISGPASLGGIIGNLVDPAGPASLGGIIGNLVDPADPAGPASHHGRIRTEKMGMVNGDSRDPYLGK